MAPRTTPDARYDRMEQRFGLLARAQLTCGMHVHVSVDSRDDAVTALDRIRPWLPTLTALSANSPFWQGQDSDHASFRSVVWGQWPTAGPTQAFGDAAGYDTVLADLLATETILDSGMLYFDARLSVNYPTLEIRVADVMSSLDDAVVIPALARALVDAALDGGLPGEDVRVEVLRVASWRAAASGLSSCLVDPLAARARPAADLLDDLVSRLSPYLEGNGDLELVGEGVARLLRDGTGADRQRAVADAAGGLEAVVEDSVGRTAR